MHCVVGRWGLSLPGFFFRFKGFFRCFIVLILHSFNHEEPALFAVMFASPRFVAMPHNSLVDRSRSSSLVNFFGAGAWMAVEGAVGLGMAGRGATLVLRTSWFNCSSWIRVKEIAAIGVYGFSPCCDFLGFDSRSMLNSAKRDRIFSSMRSPKASSFASIASSDVIVYASRSVILRSFFCCRVSGMGILEKGVAG
ncbi:hypothetical protein GW17_00054356 [Ensete ventricosum]|nr:hypothetical protein GW17_00054356 [Ensete ventricosum]